MQTAAAIAVLTAVFVLAFAPSPFSVAQSEPTNPAISGNDFSWDAVTTNSDGTPVAEPVTYEPAASATGDTGYPSSAVWAKYLSGITETRVPIASLLEGQADGTYYLYVKARDANGAPGPYAGPLEVTWPSTVVEDPVDPAEPTDPTEPAGPELPTTEDLIEQLIQHLEARFGAGKVQVSVTVGG